MKNRDEIYADERGQDEFMGDDTYDAYDAGPDLSDDPMMGDDRRKSRKQRRRERAEQEENRMRERERAAMKAEILAELRAERAADGAAMPGGDGGDEAEGEGDVRQRRRSRFSQGLMNFLSGNILSKAEVKKVYPYLLLISLLAFLYIGNIFRMQHFYRKHERLTTEVRELRAKSMTLASERMKATRQSTIMDEIKRRGLPLRESLAPNRVITRD